MCLLWSVNDAIYSYWYSVYPYCFLYNRILQGLGEFGFWRVLINQFFPASSERTSLYSVYHQPSIYIWEHLHHIFSLYLQTASMTLPGNLHTAHLHCTGIDIGGQYCAAHFPPHVPESYTKHSVWACAGTELMVRLQSREHGECAL